MKRDARWDDLNVDVKKYVGTKGSPCRIRVLLERLDPSARSAVEKALGNTEFSASAISKALRDRLGEEAPSQYSVASHRRRACRCPR